MPKRQGFLIIDACIAMVCMLVFLCGLQYLGTMITHHVNQARRLFSYLYAPKSPNARARRIKACVRKYNIAGQRSLLAIPAYNYRAAPVGSELIYSHEASDQ